MARVTATLSVGITDPKDSDARNSFPLEVDDREDGYNNGDTTFYPGDDIAYLAFIPAGVTIDQHWQNSGAIKALGGGSKAIDDEVVEFSEGKEASLKYPASGPVTLTPDGGLYWHGESAGTVQMDGQQTVRASKTLTGGVIASYSSAFTAYRAENIGPAIKNLRVRMSGEKA